MFSLQWLYLVVAFSLWVDFMMHQGSFMFQISADVRSGVRGGTGLIGTCLLLYQVFGTLAGIVLLAFYGYHVHWYAPILVVLASLLGLYAIRRIEIAMGLMRNAWILSLLGFLVVPAALLFAFSLINAS